MVLYDAIVSVLGGKRLTESNTRVIGDWTPNAVRALFISVDGVLVIFHGSRGTKVCRLNPSEVYGELQQTGGVYTGTPKINTLLNKKSFSCMEEIYVHPIFKTFRNVFDLYAYEKSLYTTNSRLRYFGYAELEGRLGDIEIAYGSNREKMGYALAEDDNRNIKVEFRSTNNEGWFGKYYLRPQYYALDKPNGMLAMYFRKFEDSYLKYKENEDKESIERLKGTLARRLLDSDCDKLEVLRRIDVGVLARKDEDTLKAFKESLKSYKRVNINIEDAKRYFGDEVNREMLDYYRKYGVLSKGESNKFLNDSSFICIDRFLDKLCLNVCRNKLVKGKKSLVYVAITMASDLIPDGEFRDEFIKKPSEGEGSIEGYMIFLGEVLGGKI